MKAWASENDAWSVGETAVASPAIRPEDIDRAARLGADRAGENAMMAEGSPPQIGRMHSHGFARSAQPGNGLCLTQVY